MMAWLMQTNLEQYIECLEIARKALVDAVGHGRVAKVGQVTLKKSVEILRKQIEWAERKAAKAAAGEEFGRPVPVAFKRLPKALEEAFEVTPDPDAPDTLLEAHRDFARFSRAGKVSSQRKTEAARRNGRLGGLSRSRAKRIAARKNGEKPKKSRQQS